MRRAAAVGLATLLAAAGVAAVLSTAGPLALAAVAALGLATYAVVSHVRRTRLADHAGEVESAAGAPLLAHLVEPADPTVLPALETGTTGAAAFAHLRSVVRRRSVGPTVLTTLGPGEGHVWVGANLAVALATSGRRVLLVDGRLGGPGPGAAGLHDVLLGSSLDDALIPGPVTGLRVLPPGVGDAAGPPPGELLTTRFAAVAEAAARDFDHVLVLAPPLDESDDALAMAAGAGLVLTLAPGAVRSVALTAQAERIRSAGARLLGVVLVAPAGDTA